MGFFEILTEISGPHIVRTIAQILLVALAQCVATCFWQSFEQLGNLSPELFSADCFFVNFESSIIILVGFLANNLCFQVK